MKTRPFTFLGLALLALAGCRHVDPVTRDLWEREDRRRESENYRLQCENDDLRDEVQSLQARLDARRGDEEPTSGRGRRRGADTPPIESPEAELPKNPTHKVPDALTSPRGSPSPDVPDVPEGLQAPSRPSAPGEEGPALDRRRSAMPLPRGSTARADNLESAVPFTPVGQSRQVASIAVNGDLTGGVDVDGRSGLLVVVEPRDAANRTIDAAAEVNVAVFDPAMGGEAARVARWDFRAADVAGMFRRIGPHRAIYLAAPWPGEVPKHARLMLYVRYLTADGRRLEANQWIDIAPPADKTSQWRPIETPRTAYAPPDGEPASETRRPENGWSASRNAEPLRTAERTADSMPERPVWSPERR